MDQPLRTNLTDSDSVTAQSRARTVRKLARGGAVVGAVAIAFVVWSVVSAHGAAARLHDATEAQSTVTVATVSPQPLSGHSDLILPGNQKWVKDTGAILFLASNGIMKVGASDKGT